ncbi:MAG: hypothetical protein JJT78_14025 [Leptospira sp.]|nr:hypothetical protein [Leptospira sp.]
MQSEVVELTELANGDYSVRVTYQFQGRIWSSIQLAFPEPKEYRLKNFRRTWNGENVPVERMEAEPGYAFYLGSNANSYIAKHISSLPWTIRKHSVLVDEYKFTPPHYEPGNKSEIYPGKFVEYILITGSAWDGVIESIEVIVKLKDGNCSRIQIMDDSYWGACEDDGVWRVILKNVNPNKNIRLVVKQDTID